MSDLDAPSGYSSDDLVFNDNFSGVQLDDAIWNTYITNKALNGASWNGTSGGGSGLDDDYNAAYFEPSQVTVNNGLTLTAINQPVKGLAWGSDPVTYPETSGAVSTYGKVEFDGGYLQISMKEPAGDGAWPAIWLMPGSSSTASAHAYEIDVQEGGMISDPNTGVNWTLHDGANARGGNFDADDNLTSGFNTYGINWDPGKSITWYLNGADVGEITSAQATIPDTPMFLMIDLQVANAATASWHTTLDSSTPSKMAMDVADVQLYQISGAGETVMGSNVPTPGSSDETLSGGSSSAAVTTPTPVTTPTAVTTPTPVTTPTALTAPTPETTPTAESIQTPAVTSSDDAITQVGQSTLAPSTNSTNDETSTVSIQPINTLHPNDISLSGDVQGAYNFIDLPNLEASYNDLITDLGENQQEMQYWYNTYEPIEHRADSFDGLDYVASYLDLITAFKSAGSEQAVLDAGASQFIEYGSKEGRTTTFNGLDYIASYGDLIKAFGVDGDAGAYHYIEHGASEGRSITFDGLEYIASYGDLINHFGANEQGGAEHFIAYGYSEGRTTTFNGLDYIAGYTDLMDAFGANADAGATHFIDFGFQEGRSSSPLNVTAYESAHPDLVGRYASDDAFLTAYINTYVTTGQYLK